MKTSELAGYLESIVPLDLQEDYDNCGLLVGDPAHEISRALLCLDVTPAVMEEAVRLQCGMVIAHHPVIFKGIRRIVAGNPESEVIRSAIRNNIALYAIHTNLDNTFDGLNAFVLRKLGAENFRILRPAADRLVKLVVFCPAAHAETVRQAMFHAGAGHIGDYDCCSYNLQGEGTFRASDRANPFVGEKNSIHVEPETRIEVILPDWLVKEVTRAMVAAHPYEEVAYDLYPLKNPLAWAGAGMTGELPEPVGEELLLQRIKEVIGIPVIRHTSLTGRPVTRVALCTGSGAFLIRDALAAGAGMFLTADLKYHDFFGMEDKMVLADIGHYESEQWVKEWLYDKLIEKFPNFAFLISKVNTNPVNYY